MANPRATGDPAMEQVINRVINARFMVFKNFVALALELVRPSHSDLNGVCAFIDLLCVCTMLSLRQIKKPCSCGIYAWPSIRMNAMLLDHEASLETTCDKSMHAYSTAYPMMACNKPYVQGALKLVVEHAQLYKDPEVVNKVLQMLFIMEYDPLLYHLEFVQDVCLDLASHYP
eukprot:scaffold56185_cov20-Tisochrysis_lutea.AAC.1